VLDLEAEKELNDGKVTIKGFATIDNVCLINIEGTGMVGVPGVLLFKPWEVINVGLATRVLRRPWAQSGPSC